MRLIRLVGFLLLAGAASTASAQQIDYSLWIEGNGVPVAGTLWIQSLVVKADRWSEAKEPFTVRMTVPPELEFKGNRSCDGGAPVYDPATRALTWTGRLTNEYVSYASCPMEFLVGPALAPGTTFTFTATVTATTPDPYPQNNTLTLIGTVQASSDIGVAAFVDAARVKPGATLTYTLLMTNFGPQDAHSAILTDELSPHVDFVSFEQIDGPPGVVDPKPLQNPGSCHPSYCGGQIRGNIGILASGSTATYRLVVRMKPGVEGARITNRVFARSNTLDLSNQNNVREVVVLAGPDADLAITESRGEDIGGKIPFTIVVYNEGPDTVNGVTVRNFLEPRDGYYGSYESEETLRPLSATASQGTCAAPEIVSLVGCPGLTVYWKLDCAIGALAPGASATITLLVDRGPRSGSFTHRAMVSPDQNDPKPSNNGSELFVDAAGSPPRKRAARR